jgi:hypothetical protein
MGTFGLTVIRMHFHNQGIVFNRNMLQWAQHGSTPNLDIPLLVAISFNKLCKLQKLLKFMNEKKKKTHCNINLMQDTKDNLDNKTIAKLVCCATQCTLFKKGTTLYLNYKVTLM